MGACPSMEKGFFHRWKWGWSIDGMKYFHRWKSGSIKILETSLYDLFSALFLEKNHKIHIFNFCIFFEIFIYELFLFVFHTCYRPCEYILTVWTCNIFLNAAQFNLPECTVKTQNFHLWNSKFLDSLVVSNSHLTISYVLCYHKNTSYTLKKGLYIYI